MGRRVVRLGSLIGRALVVWAVEAVSLFVLARVLPGVALDVVGGRARHARWCWACSTPVCAP